MSCALAARYRARRGRRAVPTCDPHAAGQINAVGPEFAPDPELKLDAIDAVPSVVAALTVTMAVVVLGYVLVLTISARRRDLAILRVLGFSRGQLLTAVGWQGTIYAFLVLAIGVPIGVLVGRVMWRYYARRARRGSGSGDAMARARLAVAVSFVVTALVAAPAAIRAVRTRPAAVLRSE